MAISATILETDALSEQLRLARKISAELIEVADLASIHDEWFELYDAATEQNINFSPEFAGHILSATTKADTANESWLERSKPCATPAF